MIDASKMTRACEVCWTISRRVDLSHARQWAISRGANIVIVDSENVKLMCRACYKEKYEDG